MGMGLQGVVSRGATSGQWASLCTAKILASEELYHSETLIIAEVSTDTAGTYYLVTEADILFPEDIDALEDLGRVVGEPWRLKIVETEFWGRPHEELPMSSVFQVHTVHPAFPERTPLRRTVFV